MQILLLGAGGVTNGPIGRGVVYQGEKAYTNSLILRCETGTRRTIQAEHRLDKWIELNS
jgi:fructose-1,6-bisphosphatase II